ncbi:MAG: hypothetical protein Q8M66_07370, partial [Actinomycetota bacterium]|nr:hypothetical protein [Actinomycetota bacterium]
MISTRTWWIAAIGIVTSAVCLALIQNSIGTTAEAFFGNLPSLITGALACLTALWAALRFERSGPLRREWLLVGLGMSALFIGDATYAYLEVVAQREVPFPSVADPFYMLSFLLLGGGLLAALISFRGSLDLKMPLGVSFVVCALATAALWTSVFWPILGDTDAGRVEKLLAVGYPVGDLWLLAFPALAV